MDTPPRKRRDNLADQLGAPLYAADPEPPYIGLVEGMIFACFTFDPVRFTPFLPPPLTLIAEHTALLVMAPTADLGWGIRDAINIFPAIMVKEMPSPDTAEACFIPLGLMSGPAQALMQRHFHPCRSGSARMRRRGDAISCEVTEGEAVVLRLRMRLTERSSTDMASQDRYISFDAAGRMVHFVVSASGTCQAAELLSLDFTAAADPTWQALQPVALNFALWIPRMLFNTSAPEAFLPEIPTDPGAARAALLAVLDRQGRACGIVDGTGQVRHANAALTRWTARHPALAGSRVHLSTQADRARLSHDITAANGAAALTMPFLLQGGDTAPPLILQIAPIDPVLAGPDTALAFFDTLQDNRPAPRSDVLQLLGLTPAEARIAAAVGAGLPPREAALRLGLAESTVRSSLKVIFGKLGLSRQADLVRLIARVAP